MNLFGLSPGELLLIMAVAMIVLGPERLPEVAASVGKWIGEFRRATQELSQQFAEDNPFAELQRALNYQDQPVAAPAAEADTTEPDATVIVPTPAMAAVSTSTVSGAPARVTSDYFTRPPLYLAIVAEWAQGGLADGAPGDANGRWSASAPLGDEWTHGVPIVVQSPPAPASDEVIPDATLQGGAAQESANGVATLDGAGGDKSQLPGSSQSSEPATVEETPGEPRGDDVSVAPIGTNGVAPAPPENGETATVAVGAGSVIYPNDEGHQA